MNIKLTRMSFSISIWEINNYFQLDHCRNKVLEKISSLEKDNVYIRIRDVYEDAYGLQIDIQINELPSTESYDPTIKYILQELESKFEEIKNESSGS